MTAAERKAADAHALVLQDLLKDHEALLDLHLAQLRTPGLRPADYRRCLTQAAVFQTEIALLEGAIQNVEEDES